MFQVVTRHEQKQQEQADKWQDEEALEKIFWAGFYSSTSN